jgi:hypothetical protein
MLSKAGRESRAVSLRQRGLRKSADPASEVQSPQTAVCGHKNKYSSVNG